MWEYKVTPNIRAISSINEQSRKWPMWDFEETGLWQEQGRKQPKEETDL